MIERLVSRCHVGESNLAVIRYVISRLADGRRTFLALPRDKRRYLMTESIRHHQANRDLYGAVITGRL